MGNRIKLPPNPTARQLRRFLKASKPQLPVARFDIRLESPATRYLSAWINLSQATGEKMPAEHLIDWIRRHDWRDTYVRLAQMSALLANANGGAFSKEILSQTVDLLAEQYVAWNATELAIGNYLRGQSSRRAIAHEEVVYFLQALALLEGANEGPRLSGGQLAFLMLAANDHLGLLADASSQRSKLEEAAADFILITRFNRDDDPLRRFVRAALMLDRPPSKGRFSTKERWAELQNAAFGRPFNEFFDLLVAPVTMWSTQWGKTLNEKVPVIRRLEWFTQTQVPRELGDEFLRSLAMTRDEARSAFTKLRHPSGLPRAVTPFYRKPFVDVGDDILVAASPWVVREQLRAGLWARFRQGAVALDAKNGADEWLRAFGYLFEDWCRHVADLARESPTFIGTLMKSAAPGDADEIEDIVLCHGRDVVLFSVKARMLPEAVAKEARAHEEILRWLEGFFVGERDRARRQRAGVLDLLSAKVTRIREGDYEPMIRRDARIFPVIVTFEDFGENHVLYRWLREQCERKQLFVHPDVAPVILASVGAYEAFFSLVAHGFNVFDMLALRFQERSRFERLDVLMSDCAPGVPRRLPALETAFRTVTDRINERLFGASAL